MVGYIVCWCFVNGFDFQSPSKTSHVCYCGDNIDYGLHGTSRLCVTECEDLASHLSIWCGGINLNFVYKIGGQLSYVFNYVFNSHIW